MTRANFTGQFKHSLDAKGRVSIPKKFLERIPDHGMGRILHGTRGFDRCAFLVCQEEWDSLVEKVEAAPMGDPGIRAFTRVFYSSASELTVDGSGRILLPPDLRRSLGLGPDEKEILLMGVGRRIELWSPAVWAEKAALAEEEYELHAAEIFRG